MVHEDVNYDIYKSIYILKAILLQVLGYDIAGSYSFKIFKTKISYYF